VNWDDLRFVLATAREGTLTGAAEALGVTHTTVARRIRSLERDIGTRVFDQLPDGFVPTPAGERLRTAAEAMEHEMLALDRDILGRDARLTGPLLVATLDMMVSWFPEVFRSFLDAYPGVRVELAASTKVLNLVRRDADVAVRLTSSPPENLVGRKVGYADYALYGARSLVGDEGEVDRSALPWVAWNERSGARLTERWMRKHAPGARVAVRVDAPEVFRRLVFEGAGIGHLPCIEGDLQPRVRRLTEPIDGFGMAIWVLTHRDLRNTARIRAFMQHVAEGIAARADDLAGRRAG